MAANYAGVLVRQMLNDALHYLLMVSRSTDPKFERVNFKSHGKYQKVMFKLPGGTEEEGETEPRAIAVRELLQETGLVPNSPSNLEDVYSLELEGHVKTFLGINYSDCSGTLRMEAQWDGPDRLSRPIWVPAGKAIKIAHPPHSHAITLDVDKIALNLVRR